MYLFTFRKLHQDIFMATMQEGRKLIKTERIYWHTPFLRRAGMMSV